jgi:hypothetical protein
MLPFLSEMTSEDSEKFLDSFFALLSVKNDEKDEQEKEDEQESDDSENKLKMDFIHGLAKKNANNEN